MEARMETKRKYSILHPLYLSFFSKDLYRETASKWSGFALVYLLVLTVLTSIPMTLTLHREIAHGIDTYGAQFTGQIPTLKFTPGGTVVDAKMPVFIKDPADGKNMIIIDTTGTVTELPDEHTKLLLMKDRVIVRKSEAETRIYDLSWISGEYILDKGTVESIKDFIRNWTAAVIFPFMVLGIYIFRIFQVLFNAVLAVMICSFVNVKIAYADLISLAAVSFTPALILDAAFTFTGIPFPPGNWGWFIIAMGYLTFSIKANRGDSKPGTHLPAG